MLRIKAKSFEKEALPMLHSILTSQGFTRMDLVDSVNYGIMLRDSSTASLYWLEIPVRPNSNDSQLVKIGKPALYGEHVVPGSVMEAATSKVSEIIDYINSHTRKEMDEQYIESPINGLMAANEEEITRLGKEMEALKKENEFGSDKCIFDPTQYEPIVTICYR